MKWLRRGRPAAASEEAPAPAEELPAPDLPEQRAETYEELRAGFTAAVSHELRTPLARLLALLESAELDGVDPLEVARRARREAEEMRELVDELLFLSELETGRQVVSLGDTPVLPVMRRVRDELAIAADHAAVVVRVAADEYVTAPVRERLLHAVVQNLAQNAVRYAGSGATVVLAARREPGAVVLEVADDGAGPSAEDLPRLFERFYRGDRARTSRGTGLGLAIVKHVITAAGGSVEAEGGPGAGLTVRCRFPQR